jgi:hypothetical protein
LRLSRAEWGRARGTRPPARATKKGEERKKKKKEGKVRKEKNLDFF